MFLSLFTTIPAVEKIISDGTDVAGIDNNFRSNIAIHRNFPRAFLPPGECIRVI
jgi:hypothetical protein